MHIGPELRAAINKHIPSDRWVDMADTIPPVVFGVDPASGPDSTVLYHTADGVHFTEIRRWPAEEKPAMRNVTPQKPKLLKESHE